jgi:trans-AT polyketide synthase, acyltransferase and oxidoreductase domains
MMGARLLDEGVAGLLDEPDRPLYLRRTASGELVAGPAPPPTAELAGILPPVSPEKLGHRSFLRAHGLRYAYVAGEMATGIATARLVIAMGRAGMLGFLGAAGLSVNEVERAIDEIEAALGPEVSWGANLIHSPNEPLLEEAVTELYLRRGVRRVCASAFMGLSPNVVRYAANGLRVNPAGVVERQNHLFAKISRPEVARHFMSPPPAAMLQALVAAGKLRADEAELAARLPVAEDVTVEADSGGHTDNRPLVALFPTLLSLRDELGTRHGYGRPIRVGAAGGLGTPGGVAAAFALGAAYVVTGSVNQGAVEAGTSAEAKALLAQASIADVTMAPASDMFELGVKVQVLKRGTMFAVRAARLYELYSTLESLEAIPAATRQQLEREIFKAPLEKIWDETRAYWVRRDAREVARAERSPKHRMALVFRWYLGNASRWARAGDPDRRLDYQIWCGPAMGAFNAWTAGSFLEKPENRRAVDIARNLLAGAAAITRAHQLRSLGVDVPDAAFAFAPRPLP